MNYWHWFDWVFCISHPITERKDDMTVRLASIGLFAPQFVYAARPKSLVMSNMRRNPSTEFGCNLSHIKAVGRAVEVQAKRALFLEDDVVFSDGAETILRSAIEALPEDWDV
jgi:GR25 family glycosyltransferase involved in LPS biosynthesis